MKLAIQKYVKVHTFGAHSNFRSTARLTTNDIPGICVNRFDLCFCRNPFFNLVYIVTANLEQSPFYLTKKDSKILFRVIT